VDQSGSIVESAAINSSRAKLSNLVFAGFLLISSKAVRAVRVYVQSLGKYDATGCRFLQIFIFFPFLLSLVGKHLFLLSYYYMHCKVIQGFPYSWR